MGWPQGQAPLGEAVGEVSAPAGSLCLYSVPIASALLQLARVSRRTKREEEAGWSLKSPRQGRGK